MEREKKRLVGLAKNEGCREVRIDKIRPRGEWRRGRQPLWAEMVLELSG